MFFPIFSHSFLRVPIETYIYRCSHSFLCFPSNKPAFFSGMTEGFLSLLQSRGCCNFHGKAADLSAISRSHRLSHQRWSMTNPRKVWMVFHGKKHRKADGTFNTYTWSCFFGGKHIWIWITYEYSMGKSKIRVVEVLNGKSCIMFMGDVPAVAMWHWLPEGTLR